MVKIGEAGVKSVELGNRQMVLVGGPCVIESKENCFQIARTLQEVTGRLGMGFVFKASFDKANRTSRSSYRGPGIEGGLAILQQVRQEFALPVLTDIHLPEQAALAAEVADILQIPAFLARQTDLLEAAAATGKPVQVKKAQFMAPWDMKNVVEKLRGAGCARIILVERGSSFGYNRLVADMGALGIMRELGCPVLMDATHATQQPSGLGGVSGGSPALAKVLARAAIAAGADGLFMETHPEPGQALSDATSMVPLAEMENLLKTCKEIFELIRK